MAVLTCEKLNYRYSVGTPFETAALQDVSFSVEEGEIVGIIGHTGSGKSTLIQHLNGLIEPQSGKVYVDGADIWSKQNRKQIRRVRFQVGLCFQYPEYQIFEEDVYKEIAFGPKQMGLDSEESRRRGFHSMELVGLSRDFAEQSPFDLSGGQKQRICIARAILKNAPIFIFDDSFSALDFMTEARLRIQLGEKIQGRTQIVITQRISSAMSSDCIFVMDGGRLVDAGRHEELLAAKGRYYETWCVQCEQQDDTEEEKEVGAWQ